MGWIIQSLAEVMMEITFSLLNFFTSTFQSIKLDINGNGKGLFDELFFSGTASQVIINLMLVFGIFLVLFIFIIEITKGMLGPFSESQDHPGVLIGKTALASFFTAFSYKIFIYLETMMNVLYCGESMPGGGFLGIVSSGLTDYKETAKNGLFSLYANNMFDKAVIIKDQAKLGLPDVVLWVLLVILFLAMLIEFVKLMMEFVARYVLLGVMFYTCPLAFACVSSSTTRPIFSAWIRMIISQFILMMMSAFFMAGFIGALTTKYIYLDEHDYMFASKGQFVIQMFCLIAWLQIGQRVDQYMKGLGLNTAQTGSNLWATAMEASAVIKSVRGVARAGANVVKATGAAAGISNMATAEIKKFNDSIPVSAKKKKENGEKVATSADRVNGKMTAKGGSSVLNAKDAIVAGAAATEAANAALSPDLSAKFNLPDYDPDQTRIEDGKVTFCNSDGQSLMEVGNASLYEASDGPSRTFQGMDGNLYSTPALENLVSKDIQSIDRSKLPDYLNGEKVSWNDATCDIYNGTLTARTKSGATYTTAIDYMTKSSNGATSVGKGTTGKDNIGYTVYKGTPTMNNPSKDYKMVKKQDPTGKWM